MKLGTENKTKTAIAGGLVIVAAFALYNWVFSNTDTDAATAAATVASTSAAAQKPGKTGARKGGTVLAGAVARSHATTGCAEVE